MNLLPPPPITKGFMTEQVVLEESVVLGVGASKPGSRVALSPLQDPGAKGT
jgi:hypothetical protein